MGTMRSYDPEVHQKVLDRIRELVDANASACHAKAKLELAVNVPAIVNDPEMARAVDSYLEDFPMALIVNNHGRISASDDFGFAGEKVPSLMLMLGCKPEGVTDNNFHNPHVVMDDRALPIGTALWCHLAVHWLQDAKKIFSHREAQEKKPPQRAASFLERQVAL